MLDYWTKGITGALDPKVESTENDMDDFIKSIANAVLLPFDIYANNPMQTMVNCSDLDAWKNYLLKYAASTSMILVLKQKTATGAYYHAAYGATAPRIKV